MPDQLATAQLLAVSTNGQIAGMAFGQSQLLPYLKRAPVDSISSLHVVFVSLIVKEIELDELYALIL
ncbi:MAG: hypothetical protein ACREX4_02670 [Gammaproteobacteria bacterium]